MTCIHDTCLLLWAMWDASRVEIVVYSEITSEWFLYDATLRFNSGKLILKSQCKTVTAKITTD